MVRVATCLCAGEDRIGDENELAGLGEVHVRLDVFRHVGRVMGIEVDIDSSRGDAEGLERGWLAQVEFQVPGAFGGPLDLGVVLVPDEGAGVAQPDGEQHHDHEDGHPPHEPAHHWSIRTRQRLRSRRRSAMWLRKRLSSMRWSRGISRVGRTWLASRMR